MATLTATLDNNSPNLATQTITGTFDTTADGPPTADQIVLLPTTGYIDSFVAACEDGTGVLRTKCNYNSSNVATNGTVLVEANHIASLTYRFVAKFRGL